MEGVWVVLLVGCGWFLKLGGYSICDFLGLSIILMKLLYIYGYINWLLFVKKYVNNFNLMFYICIKKEFFVLFWFCKEIEILNFFFLFIMLYVYLGFFCFYLWGKMFVCE